MLVTTTKDDAHANYLKNRGEPGKWFEHKADFREEKPVPRIRDGGFDIVEKCKPTIGELLLPSKCGVQAAAPPERMVRLTTEDALRIANKFQNQPDRWFDFGGNLYYKPPKPPARLYPESVRTQVEANQLHRSHDWYKHIVTGPVVSSDEPQHAVPQCFGTEAREIRDKMKSSHADQWWSHPNDRPRSAWGTRPESAPIEPPQHCRVKYEGEEYASRARGIGAELLIHNSRCDPQYNDDALPYRCVSSEAGSNCRTQTRGGDMARCMGRGSARDTGVVVPKDRVGNDEARENLLRGREGTMASMSVQGNSVPVRPKVRPEAEEFYQRSRGEVGNVIDQSQNKGYQSPKPKARITSLEAQQAADINKGVMSSIVGETSYRNPAFRKKNQVRGMKTEAAREIARRSCGSSMKQLVENYRLAPDPPKPRPVIHDIDESAALRRSTSMQNILVSAPTNCRAPPPDVPPLRISGLGLEIQNKSRGTDFFKTIQQQPPSK